MFCLTITEPQVVSTAWDKVISAKVWKDWECQEWKQWSQAATSILLLNPNQCPDVSVISILPRYVTTVFVAWRMGALTAGHLFCPEGHRLSRHLVSECIGATTQFQGLDFSLPAEDPNINQSVIDFVF